MDDKKTSVWTLAFNWWRRAFDADPLQGDRVSSLDGLRGVCALAILIAHFEPIGFAIHEPLGLVAMDTFFCLSGYVITKSIRRSTPRQFFIRRAARILPPFLVMIAAVGLWMGWAGCLIPVLYLAEFFAHDAKPNLMFFHLPLRHTWSLAIEEHFYMLWPWCVWFQSAASLRRLAAWLIIVPVTAAIGWHWWSFIVDDSVGFLYFFDLFHWPALAIGALLAVGAVSPQKVARFAIVIGLALWVAVTGRVVAEAGYAVSTTAMSALIVAGAIAGNYDWVLTWKPLRIVGMLSYGLYLYHFPIFYSMQVWGQDHPVAFFVAAFGLTFTAAALSWVALEFPIIQWAKRITPSKSRAGASAPALPVLA